MKHEAKIEEKVARHLENGANVVEEGWNEWTALRLAAIFKHENLVQLLLNYRGSISKKDELGNTALHSAARFGHEIPVLFLLENEANINKTGWRGNTALCCMG